MLGVQSSSLVARLTGAIKQAGYTPLMLVVLLSTFTLLFGLGIVGSYVWRTYENSKGRPGCGRHVARASSARAAPVPDRSASAARSLRFLLARRSQHAWSRTRCSSLLAHVAGPPPRLHLVFAAGLAFTPLLTGRFVFRRRPVARQRRRVLVARLVPRRVYVVGLVVVHGAASTATWRDSRRARVASAARATRRRSPAPAELPRRPARAISSLRPASPG